MFQLTIRHTGHLCWQSNR